MLPQIAPDVPHTLSAIAKQGSVAQIARALLDAGILDEYDWNGDVAESLNSGLARWVCREIDLQEASCLHVDLNYTDDIVDTWGMDAENWMDNICPVALRCEADQTPVGAFALTFDTASEIIVGPAVLRLEAVSEGLGFCVLHLVEAALNNTLPVLTLSDTREKLDLMEGWREGDEDENGNPIVADETDPDVITLDKFDAMVPREITLDKFDAMVPREAWQGVFDADILERAHQQYARRPSAWEPLNASILDQALDLWALMQAREVDRPVHGVLCHAGCCGLDWPLLAVIRWDRDDFGARILDEMNDLTSQIESSEVMWMQGFVIGREGTGPGTLASACHNLRVGLQIIAACDRLLGMLRHSETLSEVFAQEQARERARV